MRSALVLSIVLASAACSELVIVQPDTGAMDSGPLPSDAQPRDAARADASVTADGGTADTGLIPDSDAALDAAAPDASAPDAGRTPLDWTEMLLPANAAPLNAVFGRSATEIYAGSSTGKLLAYDGMSWTQIWFEPGNHELTALWASPGTLYVAAEPLLYRMTGAVPGTPATIALPGSIQTVNHVFGYSDTEVYAVVTRMSDTALIVYDGTQARELWRTQSASELKTVWGPGPGTVYFGGTQGTIGRVDGSDVRLETVAWPAGFGTNEIALFTFSGIASVGGKVVAVGSRFLIFERDVNATWRLVHSPLLTDDLYAVAGAGAGGLAVGRETSQGPLVEFDARWAPTAINGNLDFFDIWAAGPDDYFVAGMLKSSLEGRMFRGRRR